MDERALAAALLDQSEKTLCAALPSLLRGLRNLRREPREGGFATDGRTFWYDPAEVCRLWRESPAEGTRVLLHSLLHCLLLHPYETAFRDRKLWDLACDVCVEALADDWRPGGAASAGDEYRRTLLAPLKARVKHLSAENLYYAFRDDPSLADLPASAFARDGHGDWLFGGRAHFAAGESNEMTAATESIYQIASDRTGDTERTGKRTDNDVVNSAAESDEEAWKKITAQTLADMGASSRYGATGGLDTVILGAAVREKGNYERFLRRFLAVAETPEPSDEAFDYIFYTYGLKLYGNMPIIEPLESTENPRLRRLFIAIDTSGSVRGETVRAFVEKTCGILRTSGFYSGNTLVTVYQCDTEIRDVAEIRTPDDLERYAENVTLRGFGGTDFRPVFDAVDEACRDLRRGEMNGLLYFTDGDGEYPAKAPAYRTVFLLSDACFDRQKLPAWAIGVPLDRAEFAEGAV